MSADRAKEIEDASDGVDRRGAAVKICEDCVYLEHEGYVCAVMHAARDRSNPTGISAMLQAGKNASPSRGGQFH